MLKLYLLLERLGLVRRNDSRVLQLEALDLRLGRALMAAGAVLLGPILLLFLLLFLVVLLPVVAAYWLYGMFAFIFGFHRPALITRYEWWEWEEMKEQEARRLGKVKLTAQEEHALEERVKKEMHKEWQRSREGYLRKWKNRLHIR
jgi:fatty acid desaturase